MALSTIPNNMQAALTSAQMPAGTIIQTVSGHFNQASTNSSLTYVDVSSDLNLTITPTSASNKLLLTGNIVVGPQDDSAPCIRLLGNGSEVGSNAASGNRKSGHTGMSYCYYTSRGTETYYDTYSYGINFLTDAIGTTSSIVCKPQMMTADASAIYFRVNTSMYNGDADWIGIFTSTFTVQEIAQ